MNKTCRFLNQSLQGSNMPPSNHTLVGTCTTWKLWCLWALLHTRYSLTALYKIMLSFLVYTVLTLTAPFAISPPTPILIHTALKPIGISSIIICKFNSSSFCNMPECLAICYSVRVLVAGFGFQHLSSRLEKRQWADSDLSASNVDAPVIFSRFNIIQIVIESLIACIQQDPECNRSWKPSWVFWSLKKY